MEETAATVLEKVECRSLTGKRRAALAGGQGTQTSDVYEGSLLKLGRNALERAIQRGAD